MRYGVSLRMIVRGLYLGSLVPALTPRAARYMALSSVSMVIAVLLYGFSLSIGSLIRVQGISPICDLA